MHKLVRNGVTVAGLAALLALTGCGSDDKGDSGKGDAGKDKVATGGTGDAGASSGGSDGGKEDGGEGKSVEGNWMSADGSKPVVLSVTGEQAVLVADGHVCSGTAKGMGKVMLSLKCADGNTDRTMGSVDSNDGTKITVSWDAGKSDTLTKTEAGKLPEMPKLPGAPEMPELPQS